jgi:pimeloyl-ACP methyl ester carboxylesterase
MKPQVVCVPGSVAPAAQRYGPLLAAVGGAAELHLKDLEVYREAQPPADYSIAEEVEAIERLADARGLSRFHLVAYSGGGFISLAYAATHPRRVISLALFEPARIPGELTGAERAFFSSLASKLRGLQGSDFMATFIREQVKAGVQVPPPPPGPVSPEMQKRPAGIAALVQAFDEYPFDRELLRAAPFPVYYGYGDLSHEEQALKAGILAQLFADFRVQRFSGVHHFVPPEMIYTPDHAQTLLDHWRRAEELVPQLS